MTNETVLSPYQSLHRDYALVKGYVEIRAFYRRARLACAMGDISRVELDEFLAAGADEREWLSREIDQQKVAIATRRQALLENDGYRDVDTSTLGLPQLGALGFEGKE